MCPIVQQQTIMRNLQEQVQVYVLLKKQAAGDKNQSTTAPVLYFVPNTEAHVSLKRAKKNKV